MANTPDGRNAKQPTHPAAQFRPYRDHRERVFAVKPAEPDIGTALVFLDANVLLAPYRTSGAALDAISGVYAQLAKDGRLIVPGQVAVEFARNRHEQVSALYKSIRDRKALSISTKVEFPPIVKGLPAYEDATKQLARIRECIRSFHTSMDAMARAVASWQNDDPVLNVYQPIFTAAVVRDISIPEDVFESIRRQRFDDRMPPGWRDKDKADGGGGDLRIWLTILEVAAAAGRDAIFVTEEKKDDWFHRAGDEPLFPRFELIEEFASATKGHRFGAIPLSALLLRLGAAPEIVDQIREGEQTDDWLFSAAHGLPATSMAVQLMIERGVSGVGGTLSTSRGPDIGLDHVFVVGGQSFGLLIKLFGKSQSVDNQLEHVLRMASETRARCGLAEVAVIVAIKNDDEVMDVAARYEGRVESGQGVSLIVAYAQLGLTNIILNTSQHPVLREAFPDGR